MTLAHHPDTVVDDHGLCPLVDEAEMLLRVRESQRAWGWIVVLRIRVLLDASIDALADLADGFDSDEPRARRVMSTRDEVASHLRAADHVVAAGGRSETYGNLLAQAVALLAVEVSDLRD